MEMMILPFSSLFVLLTKHEHDIQSSWICQYIHRHDLADNSIKHKRVQNDEKTKKVQERLKEKFIETYADRYPATRQLVLELFMSVQGLYIVTCRSKSVSGIDL